jgi:serine/threonine protein kinase
MLAIGDVLQNRYRIVRQLGHGGMGTVYEAHDDRFETSVALKEVLIDLAKIADPNQQQMVARAFEREAKTLALLHHEAFPHVIDYFSERDHQYLIMELIRGEDLGEQLQKRKKPFDFKDVLNWTHQLLDALDYLHTQEQPIIHRDLKPQNMKLTARGKIKVLDFGIAKGADNKSSSTITNQTFVAATLNYSPIEQLLRVLDPTFREFISQRHKEKVEDILEHTADARSDLYSLGATLYQLLTATQPHDTLKRALDLWAGKPDPLPRPKDLNPEIPD